MKQLKKTLLTLVALLALTTGAWATTPNSIVINGTPQVGDKSISLTYHFDPNNVPGINSYAPTLKVKCAADNKWDETLLSLNEVSSGTTNISLSNLGEFEAGKTYEVCFAYNNGNWVDEVFQTFVPAAPASAVTVDWNKTSKTGTFTQPAGNVTVSVEYFPQAALTAVPTAINDVPATTDGDIVKAGTVANIGSTETAQGTVMYYVSTTALDDDALLDLAADAWKADVPTAKSLAQGQAYVYYYVRGKDSDNDEENFSDGDILAANALNVTIAAEPTYAVSLNKTDLAEGEPALWKAKSTNVAEVNLGEANLKGVKKSETVTVTYTGTKKVIGVKAEKKSAADPTVTLTPGEIGDLTSGGSSSKAINGITIAVSGDAHFNTAGLMQVSANDPETGEPISGAGTFTFTSSVGKIKRIDINHNSGRWWGSGAGWPDSYNVSGDNNTFTWSGTPAASVTLNGSCNDVENCHLHSVSSFVFTLEPTN